MKFVIVASTLVFLMAGPARAQVVHCDTFNSSDTGVPQFVRDYLDESKNFFVRVCGGGYRTQYSVASDLVRDGNICRYLEYELSLSGTNPIRLERKPMPLQTYMLISESETCPSPGAIDYVATNNVAPDSFEHLMHIWRDAISSSTPFDGLGVPDAIVVSRLRNAILQGGGNRLALRSVALLQDRGLWKSYYLHVADPDHSDQFYAVFVSSWFGRTYGISDVRAGIY